MPRAMITDEARKIDRTQWKTAFDKPFVLSEFGADAQAGRFFHHAVAVPPPDL